MGKNKGSLGFLDNDRVEPRKIIELHIEKTKERYNSSEIILCVQDTTILNYRSRKKKVTELGKIRKSGECMAWPNFS